MICDLVSVPDGESYSGRTASVLDITDSDNGYVVFFMALVGRCILLQFHFLVGFCV